MWPTTTRTTFTQVKQRSHSIRGLHSRTLTQMLTQSYRHPHFHPHLHTTTSSDRRCIRVTADSSGVARAWSLGGKEVEWRFRSWDTYQNVRVGVIASAEGAKLRLPKARSPPD